ncbi:MAG: carboxypeptidase regulatory-like domain-containing protein, partial [Tumebacillaceae bacterium]
TDVKGYALANATVAVTSIATNSEQDVQTAADGSYTTAALVSGNYQLQVFVVNDTGSQTIAKRVDVGTGTQTVNFDFSPGVTSATAALEGTALGSDGKALTDTTVMIKHYEQSDQQLPTYWASMSVTNGAFKFGKLPPGSYSVELQGSDANGNPYQLNRTVTASANAIARVDANFQATTSGPFGALSGALIDPPVQPLAGATVGVYGTKTKDQYFVPLDATGHFQVGNLVPDSYRVSFYSTEGYSGVQIVNVTAGQVAKANFAYSATHDSSTSAMKVSLIDQKGAPITGEDVTISLRDYSQWMFTSTMSLSAETDEHGQATFGYLRPGNYEVSFTKTVSDQTLSGRQLVTLSANGSGTVTITFAQSQDPTLGTIKGTLTDDQDQPINNASVSADLYGSSGDVSSSYTEPVNTDGSYVFGSLQPGKYKVSFSGATANGNSVSGNKVLQVNAGGTAQGDFQFAAHTSDVTGAVSGQLTDGNGQPIAGVDIWLVRTQTSDSTWYSMETAADGKYSFGNIVPGNYQLQASILQDGHYTDVQKVIRVTAGVTTKENLSSVVGPTDTLGAISGTVLDSQGHPLANALILVSQSNQNITMQAETDGNGKYLVGNLPPGSYRVDLFATLPAGSVSAHATCMVTANQTATQNVSFFAQSTDFTGGLKGTVTDKNGKAFPEANVTVSNKTTGASWGMQTDAAGLYSVGQMLPGTYDVTAVASVNNQVMTLSSKQVTIKQGNVAVLDLSAKPDPNDASLSGKIIGSDGKPLANQSVYVEATTGSFFTYGTTDATGVYHFDGLDPNTYQVDVYLNSVTANAYAARKTIVLGTKQKGTLNFNFQTKQSSSTGSVTGTMQDT